MHLRRPGGSAPADQLVNGMVGRAIARASDVSSDRSLPDRSCVPLRAILPVPDDRIETQIFKIKFHRAQVRMYADQG